MSQILYVKKCSRNAISYYFLDLKSGFNRCIQYFPTVRSIVDSQSKDNCFDNENSLTSVRITFVLHNQFGAEIFSVPHGSSDVQIS